MSEVNEGSLMVAGKRGRPRATEAGSRLSIWVPVSLHDRLARLALRNDTSVSREAAALLKRFIQDESSAPIKRR